MFPLPTLHSADKFYFEAFVFRALYYSKAFVFRVSFPTLYLRPSRAPAPASPGARLTLGAGVGEVGGDMGPGLEKSRNSWGYKGRVGKKGALKESQSKSLGGGFQNQSIWVVVWNIENWSLGACRALGPDPDTCLYALYMYPWCGRNFVTDGATNKVAVLGVGWLVSHYTIWHLVQCVSAMLVMITCWSPSDNLDESDQF